MNENENINAQDLTAEELSEILQVRRDKLDALKAAGQDPFQKVKYDFDTYTSDIINNFEAMEGSQVKIAGRIMSRRDMGKANFIDVADGKGRIQCYVRVDDVGEDCFNAFKKWDIGDIIGLSGKVFRTRRGEISIHADSLELLVGKESWPFPVYEDILFYV